MSNVLLLGAMILVVLDSAVRAQIEQTYVADWYGVFLSNLDLMSSTALFDFGLDDTIPARPRIFSHSTFHDFYREKRNARLTHRAYQLELQNGLIYPFQIGGKQCVARVGSQMSHKEIRYAAHRNESFALESESTAFGLALRVPVISRLILVSGGVGLRQLASAKTLPWSLGVAFTPSPALSFDYRRHKEVFLWQFNLHYQGTPLALDMPEDERLDGWRLSLAPFVWLRLLAAIADLEVGEDSGRENSGKTLATRGHRRLDDYTLCAETSRTVAIEVGYRHRQSDVSGHVYDGSESFGKLAALEENEESWRAGLTAKLRDHALGVDLAAGHGALHGSGHVESWPFTSTWIDLLGLRSYFRMEAQYAFRRVKTQYAWRRKNWRLNAAVTFENLRPTGAVETWEPLFLVFGKRNTKKHSFSGESRDGFYFSLGIESEILTGCALSYQFNQYLPTKTASKSSQDTGEPVGDGGVKKSVYGGGQHVVHAIFTL